VSAVLLLNLFLTVVLAY